MANNFHYIATPNRLFCSQTHGNDSNDGLTPETPKKTLAAIRALVTSTRNDVILSGHFLNEVYGNPGSTAHSITGDGLCIIEYPENSTAVFSTNATTTTITFNNIVFNNTKFLVNSVNFSCYNFNYCSFNNISIYKTYNCAFNYCTIYNSWIGGYTTTTNSYFASCKLFNSYVNMDGTGNNYNSYYNKACLVEIGAVTAGRIGTYNNYECKFKYLTNYYNTLTDLVTAYSVLNSTQGNRSDTITFNGPQYGDYSVPSGSALLNTSLWNSQVCGNARQGSAIYWANGLTNWTISQTGAVDDLEMNADTYTLQLKSGHTVGTITRNSNSQLDAGALWTLKTLKWLGNLSFNNGTGINFPKINSYTTGDAGYIPIRATVSMKYSPVSRTSGEWDAMPWFNFDLGSDSYGIKTDGTYGNGDPGFDYTLPIHLGGIQARYFLLKITLRSTV